jgi:hypothetical protein
MVQGIHALEPFVPSNGDSSHPGTPFKVEPAAVEAYNSSGASLRAAGSLEGVTSPSGRGGLLSIAFAPGQRGVKQGNCLGWVHGKVVARQECADPFLVWGRVCHHMLLKCPLLLPL